MSGLIYPFPQRVLPSAAAEATGAAPVPAPVALPRLPRGAKSSAQLTAWLRQVDTDPANHRAAVDFLDAIPTFGGAR